MAAIDFGSWDKVSPVLSGGLRRWANDKGIFAGRDCQITKRDGSHWIYIDGKPQGSRIKLQDAKNLATDIVCGR